MLITNQYRDLNAQLHGDRPDYGSMGHKWAAQITSLANEIKARSIIDFGAGKATLAEAITPAIVVSYDPAIPEISELPAPADLVVSTDVLEHVEPDCIDDVLDTIKRLALKAVFLTIHTKPAKKFLADGRNAHLIQRPPKWWLAKICDRWELQTFTDCGGIGFVAVAHAQG